MLKLLLIQVQTEVSNTATERSQRQRLMASYYKAPKLLKSNFEFAGYYPVDSFVRCDRAYGAYLNLFSTWVFGKDHKKV